MKFIKFITVLTIIGVVGVLAWVYPFNGTPKSVNSPGAKPRSSLSSRLAITPRALVVKRPWRPGLPQKGVSVYLDTSGMSPEQVYLTAVRDFNYVVRLGANSVSLSFPFFTGGIHDTHMNSTSATPPPLYMNAVLRAAKQHRLRVTLRPLLSEVNLMPYGGWRGSLEPSDRNAWFANYQKFLAPYLAVAKTDHVTTFVLGVEYNSLQDDSHWPALVRWAKSRFPGQLAYSANWNAIAGVLPGLVNQLGVDAYFDTNLSDDASVPQISAVWNSWLKTYVSRRVVLSEVGIAAETGAYRHPALWGDLRTRFDPEIQRRWFVAACQAFRQNQLAGIYFWRINFGQNLDRPPSQTDRGNFLQRPAATAVKQCFRG